MEKPLLQLFFIIGSALFLCVIIFLLRKKELTLKYSLLWLLTAVVMLTFSIFPGIVRYIASVLGFELTSNALFALLLGFVIVILLSLSLIASRQTKKTKTLVQSLALLEKRVRELEDKNP